MDMKNLQVALPSSESSTPKYTFMRPFPQCFSLPYPIIKYIIQNRQSGKVWKKLITSCKYFYSKYPVLPVKTLEVYFIYEADGEIFDSSKPFPKLWIYDALCVDGGLGLSALIEKIFKFDLRRLYIDYQILTLNGYQKLTSSGSVTMLYLFYCEIKNADGTIVTADKLLENLKHLKMFRMKSPNPLMFQLDAVKKMVPHLYGYKTMRSFALQGIKETFDFPSFVDFPMKNETVDVYLSFDIVSDAYKEMVRNVVKEIEKNPSLKVPDITFFWEFFDNLC